MLGDSPGDDGFRFFHAAAANRAADSQRLGLWKIAPPVVDGEESNSPSFKASLPRQCVPLMHSCCARSCPEPCQLEPNTLPTRLMIASKNVAHSNRPLH